jgi:hypothetical protein
MENSKSNFKALVAKMQQLKENEQGKLKGGVSVVSSAIENKLATTNYVCPTNMYCPKKK